MNTDEGRWTKADPRSSVFLRGQSLQLAEPVAIFGLIMLYIWDLRYSNRVFWLPILALVVLSHLARRERAATLGFRLQNLRKCLDDYAPALLLLALGLLSAGMILETTRPVRMEQVLTVWTGYLPWGLFQQYLLNGYFLNRLSAASPKTAPVLAAAFFSGAHLPNWFLMAVTLLGGYLATRAYGRHRNLIFLGIAHATIGSLLYFVVPDSIIHHLRIGPGWFNP